ncbi:MAG: WbqC family protein [Candidatus Omnitrophica bacterium]|nr:WbqC family protein [Candidatus Omnitrophota bacterium]
MIVTIHQPEHLPWLGFFHKLNMAETYVVLDNVQYRRRYFQNRNKIRTKNGWKWIGISLIKEARDNLLIKDVKIFKEDIEWRSDNLKTVHQSYSKAKYFDFFWPEFQKIYSSDYDHLIDLNIAFIKLILKKLGIVREVILASQLNVDGEKGDLIFNITKTLNAKTYVSGISGKDYLDMKKFSENGIKVIIQEFHHPVYSQLLTPFLPCMSVIDLLFNYGPGSLDIINGIGVPILEEVFL